METSNTKSALHPLLTAAAISVTVFSAVGVAALTGLLPTTHSSARPAEPAALVSAAPLAAQQANAPEIAPPMPAAPAVSPAPAKPKVKPLAKAPVAKAPVVYRDFDEKQVIAQAPAPAAIPAPAQVESPKPVAQAGILGRVEGVREVEQPGEHTAMGPVAGGVAGAVLGNQFGEGLGKKIFTVVGAAGGAIAGREIEKRARAKKTWQIDVRLDDGTTRSIASSTAPYWNAGDRVRLVDGKLQPV